MTQFSNLVRGLVPDSVLSLPRNLFQRTSLDSSGLCAAAKKVQDLESEMRTASIPELQMHWGRLSKNSSMSEDEKRTVGAAIGASVVRHVFGFRMHEVQIRGALATAGGAIIEMQTGEGKTVVCGLAAAIRTLIDDTVHVATTNDYLAERDHGELRPVFAALNISSAYVGPATIKADKKAAYRSSITYGPGYIFGFDYLRDQIELRESESQVLGREVLDLFENVDRNATLVQPHRQTIIVDEADCVMIDESTTPLILSGGDENIDQNRLEVAYNLAKAFSESLVEGDDFTHDKKNSRLELTKAGAKKSHEFLKSYPKTYLSHPWTSYVENALYSRRILNRDENYVVEDDEIKLVDQLTGRVFEDRKLQKGLHQAVECEEGLAITPPSKVLARISRQRFFQLYDQVCGMTGTVTGSEQELLHFYSTETVKLEPNVASKREQQATRFFSTAKSKQVAIIKDVLARSKNSKQPILIGTRTISESLEYHDFFTRMGIKATLLNGVQDGGEAGIIARAGHPGAITIATNMAGRGTDIKLNDLSKEAGGLHVIATQRNESQRVDRQLAGRSARQGDPGSCQFFVSADDELIEKHAPSLAARLKRDANADGECSNDYSEEILRMQSKIERENFEKRRKLVHHDAWMNKVRQTMAES